MGERGSLHPLRVASARVFAASHVPRGSHRPLRAAQRWGIQAALQDSEPSHSTLATWRGEPPGLRAVPWLRVVGVGSRVLCDFVWRVTSIYINMCVHILSEIKVWWLDRQYKNIISIKPWPCRGLFLSSPFIVYLRFLVQGSLPYACPPLHRADMTLVSLFCNCDLLCSISEFLGNLKSSFKMVGKTSTTTF